jgi:hypothetical protein
MPDNAIEVPWSEWHRLSNLCAGEPAKEYAILIDHRGTFIREWEDGRLVRAVDDLADDPDQHDHGDEA